MKSFLRTLAKSLTLSGLLLSTSPSVATTSTTTSASATTPTASAISAHVTMCVYDPIGASGPLFQSFGYFKTEALAWGVEIDLKAYNDERIAAEDFKAGLCDLVNVPGFRARAFNRFTGTIDSIGALPTYEHLKIVLQTLASEKAAPLMVSGDYEVISIIPAGAIFMFVSDKNIRSPETMAGKTIAVLDNAPELPKLVAQAGMTPVASTLANLYSKFNNHSVDITAGPALVYEPMELYKGLEPNGGILDFPFMQATIQVLGRHSKLPPGFGLRARQYGDQTFEQALRMIKISETGIPEKYWVRVPREDSIAWSEVFRQNRLALRKENIYDSKALTLFRRVRCKLEPSLPECTANDKE
ncbi:MAG TPA: putative solute-binding protein [Dongiaceae bacterium]|nr:putative solute-binding protein [Dongiaceae bacterium]